MSKASGASGPRTISSNSIMPATPKRELFQNFVRFTGAGGVHDEDDTVPLGLEVPLLDLPREMVPNRGADLEGQDGDNRFGARRSVTSDSRTTSPASPFFSPPTILRGSPASGSRRQAVTNNAARPCVVPLNLRTRSSTSKRKWRLHRRNQSSSFAVTTRLAWRARCRPGLDHAIEHFDDSSVRQSRTTLRVGPAQVGLGRPSRRRRRHDRCTPDSGRLPTSPNSVEWALSRRSEIASKLTTSLKLFFPPWLCPCAVSSIFRFPKFCSRSPLQRVRCRAAQAPGQT
jgi:hypothetical protein